MDAILTERLGRTFPARRGTLPVRALDDVNLSVAEGELFGLLGPNGAGKTTLIKILTTLLLPSEGRAHVDGLDVSTQFGELRWRISMVSGGETSGYGLLTVREQLWMFSQFHGMPARHARQRIDELLDVVGLAESARTRIYNLSTGMRQKVNIARGLLTDPRVLFLDEPTLGLDVETAREVRAYLRRWMREGKGQRTILLTTHYMQEADELCDRIAIIHQGSILTTGTAAALKRQAGFQERYRVEFDGSAEVAAFERFGSLEVERRSDGETVVVALDSDETGYELLRLVATLAKVRSFTREEPTLEDAFVALTGQGLRE
ncbi:MAG: ABC transporter ATP-binding protein [Actinomycetota bacterium]|nr:ABC transporter ATP-binding protein [Actinomycetota bacterium]